MQVTETLNEGLKRKLDMTVPATDLVARLDEKLAEIKSKASLKGFRPGKVPMAHLKKMYGQSAMSEVMQDAINQSVQMTLANREERPAAQPKIDLSEDQDVINKVLGGEADMAFVVSYEVLPSFDIMEFPGVKIERPVVPVADDEVAKELERLHRGRREYEDKDDDGVVADGDRLGISFVGKIDGEEFDGGSSEHAHIVIGSGDFIPGFEEQLTGAKKGDERKVAVKFPDDYASEALAGKDAEFDVTVLEISAPKEGELDDEFAKSLGVDSLDKLRTSIREQMEDALIRTGRQRIKRQVLDALDDGHKFDVPEVLVESEFDSIWQRVTHEIEAHGRSFEDEGTTEEAARTQYRTIAERRVRLGLVVAEVGNANKIEVTEDEHKQALISEVQKFPGQEQQVYDYYVKNQQAMAGLRAPIFEDKVVDFIVELAEVTDKEMSREELQKQIEADEEADEVPEQHHH